MKQVLCPIVVGRDEELGILAGALDDAADGRGRAVFVVGEPGIGKSRLVQETAAMGAARSMRVLAGRAVDTDTPVPYRPLTEAIATVARASGLPEDPRLKPFRAALSRIVPEWGGASRDGDWSPIVLAEAFVRLLRSLASDAHGLVLLLEDMHWADPETLAIVEYLADNIGTECLALVATLRTAGPARSVVQALGGRRSAEVIELSSLDQLDSVRMAAACLGVESVSAEKESLVKRFADGVPFLIEELLTSPDDVPRSFADTVSARLDSMPAGVRDVLRAAAILGGRFDPALLARVAEIGEREVLGSLERAVGAQLLLSDARGVRFRHALTREAVLGELIAPARVALAAKALESVVALYGDEPDLDETSAALAETAGLRERAAALLCRAGRRAIARGALSSAEEILLRARGVTTDVQLRVEASSALLEALSLAGKFDEAIEAGSDALTGAELLTTQQRFDVRLALARAAIAASRWDEAAEHVDQARSLATGDLAPAALAHVDAVAAHVAIGRDRIDEAIAFAHSAADRAEEAGFGAVACEALEVIGRCARIGDLDAAEEAFERARARARARNLPFWEVRALHELGTIDLLRSASVERLSEAYDRALDIGALATAAVLDLQLCATYLLRVEPEAAIFHARRCRDMALRLRLTNLVAYACVYEANAHAYYADRAKVEALIADAAEYVTDDPDLMGTAWGSRACVALVEGDLKRAFAEFTRSIEYYRLSPTSAPAHTRGCWALLEAVHGEHGREAIDEVRASGAAVNRSNRGALEYAEAVLAARGGADGEEIDRYVRRGDSDLSHAAWWAHTLRRFLAEAATTGNWGNPVDWLREAETYFNAEGYDRLASSCRGLLRRAGAGVSPRARTQGVPETLQSIGVTSREAEVFGLVAEGLSNRDIAERLYLSPRTVEKHVESLIRKTGVEGRGQLVAYAASRR